MESIYFGGQVEVIITVQRILIPLARSPYSLLSKSSMFVDRYHLLYKADNDKKWPFNSETRQTVSYECDAKASDSRSNGLLTFTTSDL